ncbi:MAG: hypothetical protein GY803_18200 [Chloroflexi bacterium]|nr:hypothetical protein [Chloroflexota bacterium]
MLASDGDMGSVLAYLARETAVIVNAEGCLIWLRDEEIPDTLVCKSVFPQPRDKQLEMPRLAIGEGVAGRVAESGAGEIAETITADFHPAFYRHISESNGLKYGGEPPRLELGGDRQANGMVCFWARDNGDGFPPDEKEILFTPFTKLREVNGKGASFGTIM